MERQDIDHLTHNIELLLKIETNLKLDLVAGGHSLIENQKETETHYMRLEGVVDKVEIDYISKPFEFLKVEKPREQVDKMLQQVEDWVITDFDHFLNGNPHV